jgi:hypothetical protein
MTTTKLEALQVAATGVNITTSGTSAVVALPNGSSGSKARFVRVHATVAATVRLGRTGVAAVATDMIVDPATPVILHTIGHTHIAALQVAAAGLVNVTPLED